MTTASESGVSPDLVRSWVQWLAATFLRLYQLISALVMGAFLPPKLAPPGVSLNPSAADPSSVAGGKVAPPNDWYGPMLEFTFANDLDKMRDHAILKLDFDMFRYAIRSEPCAAMVALVSRAARACAAPAPEKLSRFIAFLVDECGVPLLVVSRLADGGEKDANGKAKRSSVPFFEAVERRRRLMKDGQSLSASWPDIGDLGDIGDHHTGAYLLRAATFVPLLERALNELAGLSGAAQVCFFMVRASGRQTGPAP